MYITKIKMKPSCFNSYSLEEIDQVYLEGYSAPGYWYKADVYDFLQQYPGSIQVGVPPYPAVIPAVSFRGEKYVKSAPNGYGFDNLLSLPRE